MDKDRREAKRVDEVVPCEDAGEATRVVESAPVEGRLDRRTFIRVSALAGAAGVAGAASVRGARLR